jgi:hypothetical protein
VQRTPLLVLISGILSAAFGSVLLLISDRVEGLVLLAVAITALGWLLLAIWALSVSRRRIPEDGADTAAPPVPGAWYPYALVGVVIVLGCWLIYWTQLR